MPTRVKRTIWLPPDLAREVERRASDEGTSFSAIVEEALRDSRANRLRREIQELQAFWSRKALERGLLTQRDLDRYLAE
jgi:hypothetical protein